MSYPVCWALALLLLACLLPQEPQARQPQSELKVLTEHLPNSFDHNYSNRSWAHYVHANLAEGLLSISATGAPMPGQAESWSISEDGLQFHFKLRQDAYWSDGKPVVAEDFVLAWRRMVDPSRESEQKTLLHPLKNYKSVNHGEQTLDRLGVQAIDQKRLLVTLSAPAGYFLRILQTTKLAPVPSHYASEQIDRMYSGQAGHMVVNGPYNLESNTEKEIRLSKNKRYWDADRVYYERIRFIKANDADGKTAIKSVITGEVDLAIDRRQEELHWVEENYPDYFWEIPTLYSELYVFNSEKNTPLTQYDDVRQALSMSIDREKLSKYILKGSVTPTYTFTPISLFSFTPPSRPAWAKLDYPQRLKQASEILKNRGISPEKPVSIELSTQTYNNRHQVALAIKYAWQKLGVELKIITRSTPETYKHMRQGHFEMARVGWLADYADPYDFLSVLGRERKGFAGRGIRDHRVDSLLAKSTTALDQRHREAIFKEVEEINHRRNLVIPLYQQREYLLKSPHIHGVGQQSFVTSMRWVRPTTQPLP